MDEKQYMTEMTFEPVGQDSAKNIYKSFLETAMNLEDIDSAVIIVSSKNTLKQVGFGDCLKVYGLLDFMKRQQWMRMAYPPGGRVKVIDKKDNSQPILNNLVDEIKDEMDEQMKKEMEELI